jgi:cyclopropane fatty-acyl-phospholipid synthase-like methyltransferase
MSDWDEAYAGTPPWDIGRPQPVFQALAESGALHGQVLDAGCGTGEHALMAAALGYEATGIDGSPVAIEMAREKARERGLDVRFLVADVLSMASLAVRFDTILDMGLYHTFDDDQRVRYVENLRAVATAGARYLMLCFSDRQPGDTGPRRVSEQEIRRSFADGWRVDAIEPAVIETIAQGGPYEIQAWLVRATRTTTADEIGG